MRRPIEYVKNQQEVDFKASQHRYGEIIDEFGIETVHYLLYEAENNGNFEECILIVKRIIIYNTNNGSDYPTSHRQLVTKQSNQ